MNFVFRMKDSDLYKLKLAEEAKNHHKMIEEKYQDITNISIANSKIYTPEMCKRSETGGIKPIIQILDTDTVSALYMINSFYSNIGILNFASFKYPGGMFLKGSSAQEEALCHESNLYETLKFFNNTYYSANIYKCKMNPTINSTYLDRGIYSSNIMFLRENKNVINTAVITVAAPNIRNADAIILEKFNTVALSNRIKFVLDIAETENLKTLILGAFGCGVFRQNPEEVAYLFKEYLLSEKYNFTNIIFAIPDSNSKNYKAFVKVLKDSLSGIYIDN